MIQSTKHEIKRMVLRIAWDVSDPRAITDATVLVMANDVREIRRRKKAETSSFASAAPRVSHDALSHVEDEHHNSH